MGIKGIQKGGKIIGFQSGGKVIAPLAGVEIKVGISSLPKRV